MNTIRPLLLVAVPLALATSDDPDGARRVLRHETVLANPLTTARDHVFPDVEEVHYDLPSGKVFAFEVELPPEEIGERPDAALVPAATIEWDDATKRFATSWTLADVMSEAEGRDRALSHALMRRNPRSGRFLLNLPVHVGDEQVGEVARLHLEARTLRLGFVGVALAGTDQLPAAVHAVPWSLCRVDWITEGDTVDRVPVLRLDRDPAQAPEPGSGVLDDPLFRDRVYEAFGVEPPWWDRRR